MVTRFLRENSACSFCASAVDATALLRLGQGEGFFKMQAKKVILGSGRLRAGSIIAEEEMAICGDETSYLRL